MGLDNLSFGGQWRDYQKRVLDELDSFLRDGHVHVVAPPGSGKTVLGLEILRRIGKPAVVFSPTLTIRDQWVSRLSLFGNESPHQANWVSKDIAEPKAFNAITYQSFYSTFQKQLIDPDQGAALIAKSLQEAGIHTLVMDEAHHLRNEWWRSLIALKKAMKNITIVSLTATPPFDANSNEWQRYEELCGEIDLEIFIPELVKRGDLCPHQDYVHFSTPKPTDTPKYLEKQAAFDEFMHQWFFRDDLFDYLKSYPWIKFPDEHLESLYAYPDVYVALLSLYQQLGGVIKKHHYAILHCDAIPAFNQFLLEILLQHIADDKLDMLPEEERKEALKPLRKSGVLRGKTINLHALHADSDNLSKHPEKLTSIAEITTLEYELMQDKLRMVILADHIYAEDLPRKESDHPPLNRLGVAPIFEYLRRSHAISDKLGVLTGSLVIIPVLDEASLQAVAQMTHVDRKSISVKACPFDERFQELDFSGQANAAKVALITALFREGHIQALIGTTSLLGEGWDAPSANTLILASSVSSFMLCNQMRGRVIRTDPATPNKAAHIWHLSCVDPDIKALDSLTSTNMDDSHHASALGQDFASLTQRFRVFEGVSLTSPVIIGRDLSRLNIPTTLNNDQAILQANQAMLNFCDHRENLHLLWHEAIEGEREQRTLKQGMVYETNNAKPYPISKPVKSSIWPILFLGGGIASLVAGWGIVATGLGVATAATCPAWVKATLRWRRNSTVSSHAKQIVNTIIYTMLTHDHITKPIRWTIRTQPDGETQAKVFVEGFSRNETNRILRAFSDIVNATHPPRYVISETSNHRSDQHHPVPKSLSRRKEVAQTFADLWSKHIRPCELHYVSGANPNKAALLSATANAYLKAQHNTAKQQWLWE